MFEAHAFPKYTKHNIFNYSKIHFGPMSMNFSQVNYHCRLGYIQHLKYILLQDKTFTFFWVNSTVQFYYTKIQWSELRWMLCIFSLTNGIKWISLADYCHINSLYVNIFGLYWNNKPKNNLLRGIQRLFTKIVWNFSVLILYLANLNFLFHSNTK